MRTKNSICLDIEWDILRNKIEYNQDLALFCEIIMLSINDLTSKSKTDRESAKKYILSKNFDFDCSLFDIDPEKARNKILRSKEKKEKKEKKSNKKPCLTVKNKQDILRTIRNNPIISLNKIKEYLNLSRYVVRLFLVNNQLTRKKQRIEYAKGFWK